MNRSRAGFSLAEVLIALGLLGLIAVFTVPKILTAASNTENAAKVRNAVATLEQGWYNAKMLSQVQTGSAMRLYDTLIQNANTVSQSNTAAVTTVLTAGIHPCVGAGLIDGWMQFSDGVLITGLSDGPDLDNLTFNDVSHLPANTYTLCIDVNGNNAPNTMGQDVYFGNFNQFGAFEGVPSNENAKAFRWGATGEPVVNPGDITALEVSGVDVGTAGTTTFAGAGRHLVN